MFVSVVHPFVDFDFHYVSQCDGKLCPAHPRRRRCCGGMCQAGVTSDIPEGNELEEIITWQRGRGGRHREDEGQALSPDAVKVLT